MRSFTGVVLGALVRGPFKIPRMLISRRVDESTWGWSSEEGPLASLVWEVLPWGLARADTSWWYPTPTVPLQPRSQLPEEGLSNPLFRCNYGL